MRPSWRSLLFVAATDDGRLEKAHTRGADALILDLEDGVPTDSKPRARQAAAIWIERLAGLSQNVVIRVNSPWRLAAADVEAVVRPGLRAIMAPKVEDAAHLAVLSQLIGEWEDERGLPSGGIGLIALIETPAALSRLADIAAIERVVGLALGPEDLSLALGAPPGPLTLDLPCRLIALSAAVRGLMALGAPVSIAEFRDLEAYGDAHQAARGMGMTGNLCIHPKQVDALNRSFNPTPAEIEAARAMLAAWAAAGGKGIAVLDGQMIDLPVVDRARRTPAQAGEVEL